MIKRYKACADAAEVQAVQADIVAELEADYARRRQGVSLLLRHLVDC
jgi:hypothetical protein